MNDSLRKSIIKTLAYFDVFDHPLTKEELFRFLWMAPKISYLQFLKEIDIMGTGDSNDDFFFLSERESIVKIRRDKTVDNDKKRAIAIKTTKKIRYVPFVRSVLLCNNSSFEMARENSDIDVAIIIKSGRLWIGRLLVTLLLSLFRLRRNKKKTINRICLSFYTTDDNLDFSDLTITSPDIGLIYWIVQFSPIYDPDNLCDKLKQANSWIKQYLPNYFNNKITNGYSPVIDNWFSCYWKKFWQTAWSGIYGNIVEQQARSAQKAKMKLNVHSVQNEPDSRVIINDKMLKFHENDRREEYKEKWERNCANYDKL